MTRELAASLTFFLSSNKWIPHSLSKWRFLCSLNGYKYSPLMLTIESKIPSIFKHVSKTFFKQTFLGSYLIAYHSNIGVWLRKKLDEGCRVHIMWQFTTLFSWEVGQPLTLYFVLHGLHIIKEMHFGPASMWTWGVFCKIISIPHNIVMDMNMSMKECMFWRGATLIAWQGHKVNFLGKRKPMDPPPRRERLRCCRHFQYHIWIWLLDHIERWLILLAI